MKLLPWKQKVRESAPQTTAFEELALPLLPSLYNLAHWLCRNPVDAEDLMQESFLKALRGFSAFEPGSNFKAWIFRILRNTYLTSRTGLAARRTVSLDEHMGGPGDSESGRHPEAEHPELLIDRQTPEINLMHLSDRAALQAAMENLSPPLLEVVLLCDVEEMKYREIAVVLDVPIGTVMSRIARARMALRQTLGGQLAVVREFHSPREFHS